MKLDDVKTFYEIHRDEIVNHIEFGAEIDETVEAIYYSDANHNNADVTSQQKIHEPFEIKKLVISSILYHMRTEVSRIVERSNN